MDQETGGKEKWKWARERGREGQGFRERTAVIFDLRRSKGDDLDSLETKRNCLSRGLDERRDRWCFSFEEREREGGFRKRSSPLFEFFGIEKISWIHRIGGEGGKKMESSEDATVASFE